MADTKSTRQGLSVRTRFEVFKRDKFTCRYCGRTSPSVVLEVDHIIPVVEGGNNDPINLITSCWECNSGKSSVPLTDVRTGEDPHDRAVMLLERERQLREYNAVLAEARARRERDTWDLIRYWENDETVNEYPRRELSWMVSTLEWLPTETLRDFMDVAIRKGIVRDLRYVKGCVRAIRNSNSDD